MSLLFVGIAAFAGYYLFLRNFETHGGARHFTAHGQKKALEELRLVGVTIGTAVTPGGASFQTVPLDPTFPSGVDAVRAAELNGGIVLLSEDFFHNPIGALLVVTSRGSETVLAQPGTGLAILTTVPPG